MNKFFKVDSSLFQNGQNDHFWVCAESRPDMLPEVAWQWPPGPQIDKIWHFWSKDQKCPPQIGCFGTTSNRGPGFGPFFEVPKPPFFTTLFDPLHGMYIIYVMFRPWKIWFEIELEINPISSILTWNFGIFDLEIKNAHPKFTILAVSEINPVLRAPGRGVKSPFFTSTIWPSVWYVYYIYIIYYCSNLEKSRSKIDIKMSIFIDFSWCSTKNRRKNGRFLVEKWSFLGSTFSRKEQ